MGLIPPISPISLAADSPWIYAATSGGGFPRDAKNSTRDACPSQNPALSHDPRLTIYALKPSPLNHSTITPSEALERAVAVP